MDLKAENGLMDLVERLDRLREGRRAVHLHLSKLRPYNRREHHLRIAANSFEPLAQGYKGQIFRLLNHDVFFICEGASVSQIDDVVLKLRFLFSDDPLANDDQGDNDGAEPAVFCSWYDLKKDYPAFRKVVETLVFDARKKVEEEAKRKNTKGPVKQVVLEPMDPTRLASLENALKRMDLRAMLRRQPICAIAESAPPVPVFDEYFVAINELQKMLMPTTDISSDRWLFQHLTAYLDRRVLAILPDVDKERTSSASINLNVSTILGNEFLEFDTKFRGVGRRQAVIELQPLDIFGDIGGFFFARDFAHERGYKLCLDGLNHLTFPLLMRDQLKVDFMKIHWNPEMLDEAHAKRRVVFEESIKRAGAARVILSRCDNDEAIKFGRSLGIALFQGRFLDRVLRKIEEDKNSANRKVAQEHSIFEEEKRVVAAEEARARAEQLRAQQAQANKAR